MKSLAPHSGLRKPGRTLSKLLARLIYSRASVHASRSIETMSGCASLVSAGGSGPRQFSAIRLLLFRPNEPEISCRLLSQRFHSGTVPRNTAVVFYRAMLVCRRPCHAHASCDCACVPALT